VVKIVVIEARQGRIVESRIVDGDFYEVTKSVAREALEKWRPEASDFVAVKDVWTIDLSGESTSIASRLEELGLVTVVNGRRVAQIPVYTISYDNEMISDENYKEKGLYMIVPYIDDDFKSVFESEAAELTSESEEPEALTN
jgi:hypothetical protein